MLSSLRSSAIIYNDNDESYYNFVVGDSNKAITKRNSDGNVNYNINLRITQAEAPIDNHLLIKKNPMEDHIFDFESSDDDNEDNKMEGGSEPVFSSSKTLYI